MSFNDYETVAAYADLFDVSKHTIYKWIKDGKLQAVKENGQYT